VEDAGTFGQLIFAVPGADEILHAGVERRLSEADEEAQGVEMAGRFALD
jgi:hypothetical protein